MPLIDPEIMELNRDAAEESPFLKALFGLIEFLESKPKLQSNVERQFIQAQTDDKRVAIVAPLLREMSGVNPFQPDPEKSTQKSKQLREEGNRFLQKEDYKTAVGRYSASLAAAPLVDAPKSLALAYANRAVALKGLGDYSGCLTDSLRALELDYPRNLRHKLHHRLSEAYRALGDREKAESHRVAALNDLEKAGFSATDLAAKKLQYELDLSGRMQGLKLGAAAKSKDEDPSDPCCFTLQGERNKEVPAASDALVLRHTNTLGRHLKSTRVIKPGEVVIVEEPYAAILYRDLKYKHCEYCFKKCNTLVPCHNCAQVMYCSEVCRETALREYHEWECPFISATQMVNPGCITMMTLRLFAKEGVDKIAAMLENPPPKKDKRTFDFSPDGRFLSSDFLHIFYYESKGSDRPFVEQLGRALVANYLLQAMKLDTRPDFDRLGGLLMTLSQVLSLNSMEFQIKTDQKLSLPELLSRPLGRDNEIEFGAGVYPTMNLLQHSCDPNIHVFHRNKNAVAVAIKTIASDELLTFSYSYNSTLYVNQAKESRQDFLKTQLFINCRCQACVKNFATFVRLPNLFHLLGITRDPGMMRARGIYQKYFGSWDIYDNTMHKVTKEHYDKALELLSIMDLPAIGDARLSKEYCMCQHVVKLYLYKNGNNAAIM